jgi:hypothetical protein
MTEQTTIDINNPSEVVKVALNLLPDHPEKALTIMIILLATASQAQDRSLDYVIGELRKMWVQVSQASNLAKELLSDDRRGNCPN